MLYWQYPYWKCWCKDSECNKQSVQPTRSGPPPKTHNHQQPKPRDITGSGQWHGLPVLQICEGKQSISLKNQQDDVSSHGYSETNNEFTKNSNGFSNMIHFLFGAMFDLFAWVKLTVRFKQKVLNPEKNDHRGYDQWYIPRKLTWKWNPGGIRRWRLAGSRWRLAGIRFYTSESGRGTVDAREKFLNQHIAIA